MSFVSNYMSTETAKGAWLFAIASTFYIAYSSVLVDTTSSKYPMAVWSNFIASFFFLFGAIIWIFIGHPDAYNKPGVMFYNSEHGNPETSFWLRHFGTTYLKACWMYVFGCLPFIVYGVYETVQDPSDVFNWMSLFGAIAFAYLTWFMVLAAYPEALTTGSSVMKRLLEDKKSKTRGCLLTLFSEEFLLQHLGSDWLVSAWLWFWVNVVLLAGTLPYLFYHPSSLSTYLLSFTLLFYTLGSYYFVLSVYSELSLYESLPSSEDDHEDSLDGP